MTDNRNRPLAGAAPSDLRAGESVPSLTAVSDISAGIAPDDRRAAEIRLPGTEGEVICVTLWIIDGEPEMTFTAFNDADEADDDEAIPAAIVNVRLADLVPLSRALLGTLARFAETDVRDALGGAR